MGLRLRCAQSLEGPGAQSIVAESDSWQLSMTGSIIFRIVHSHGLRADG